jgi:hypothetical protein
MLTYAIGTADGHALALHIDAESSLPLADRYADVI